MGTGAIPAPGSEGLPRVPVTPPPPQVARPELEIPEDLRPFEVPEHLSGRRTPRSKPAETDRAPDRGDVEGQLKSINKIMEGLGNRLDFGIYEGTNELFVKVVDRRTNEVVKVMPPEKLLELHAKLDRAFGVILDEQV